MHDMTTITTTSATQLAHAIRTRQRTSDEVVTAYVERVDARHPALNAFEQLAADAALAQARRADAARAQGELCGPLNGVPIMAKDNLARLS